MTTDPRVNPAEDGPQGPQPQNADKAAIEEQLARIKADISGLASTLASIGSSRLNDARGHADGRIHELTRAGEQAIEDLRRQLNDVERDMSLKVREKPLQTLSVAAGIGFLAALILRR
ncbi:DUF883 family protein [Pararhizobium mangrovi]|uniref:DUF883 family protein n=1 Tax=Pararhizobium mangrovi TaxID=2590452 RepID=A0A506TZG0_9HYPH|nr:DUF883 family protein [Pararhizobium mangrovi]TPW26686.1 DUF883 family protein [Pararhizobium mangrovi]